MDLREAVILIPEWADEGEMMTKLMRWESIVLPGERFAVEANSVVQTLRAKTVIYLDRVRPTWSGDWMESLLRAFPSFDLASPLVDGVIHTPISAHAFAIRTSVLRSLGGFDESVHATEIANSLVAKIGEEATCWVMESNVVTVEADSKKVLAPSVHLMEV